MCKAEISLTYREGANCYQTLKQEMEDWPDWYDDSFSSEEDKAHCIETDKWWSLQFYPETPIGSYVLHGSDPIALIDRAIEIIKKDRGIS
jgi:hypothetical protein